MPQPEVISDQVSWPLAQSSKLSAVVVPPTGCAPRAYSPFGAGRFNQVVATARNAKILLVDDSRTVLHVLRTYLTGAGFEFFEASDGREALRLATRERPAVVIADVEIPHLSGLELCRAIRMAPGLADTRVILISSRWTPERQEEAKRLKVNAWLQKPIDSMELARLIAGWFV